MSDRLTHRELENLSEFVSAHLGLHFPAQRRKDLERGIRSAAREFGYEDEVACARWLMSRPLTKAQIEVLAGNLTVGETYFFREKETFEALERRVMPELIRSRRDGQKRLRFWSAGCCTGEEVYSLAILLHRLLPDLRHWNVTILATDLNPRFLHKGEVGVFGNWSFRGAPAWLRGRFFTKTSEKQFEILPEIKRMVTFEYLNLAEDSYPSLLNDTNAMDLILCRNVLMYFEPQQAKLVLEKLHRCLLETGWLIMGATEISPAYAARFTPVHAEGAILYRKAERESVPAAVSVPPPAQEPGPVTDLPQQSQPVRQTPVGSQIARELANEGRLEEALACADQLLAFEKLNPQTHFLRAMILQEQGVLGEAEKELRRAIYLDRDFVLAHFALGNLARNAGRRKEAGKQFENALRCLRGRERDDVLPEAEGLTAGRLAEIIAATLAEDSTA